ncbi:hypothetical protein BLA29_014424, partial [Euroglyphus maynei]
ETTAYTGHVETGDGLSYAEGGISRGPSFRTAKQLLVEKFEPRSQIITRIPSFRTMRKIVGNKLRRSGMPTPGNTYTPIKSRKTPRLSMDFSPKVRKIVGDV